jgi:DNA-directed RNA polymerase subunit RPC12/RpoP
MLDRVMPENGPLPLDGGKFADWESLIIREGNEVLAAAMEERAKLDQVSEVTEAGRCPYCSSDRTYLKKQRTDSAIRSPLGEISISFQNARCRACNGSFSPSKQNMGASGGGASNARRRAPRGA